MDVIVIFNGLGNQMSQYAFYLEKKLRNRQTTYFVLNPRSTYELERLFGISYRSNLMCRMIYKLLDKAYFSNHIRLKKILRTALNAVGIRLIVEPITRNYSLSNFTHHPGLTFYRGGWHSELNFTSVVTELRRKFIFPPSDDEEFKRISALIIRTQSISLHIRRGDYLDYSEYQGVCTEEYYERAIEYIRSHVENPVFFVFSDDKEYAINKFSGDDSFRIVDFNTGENSWRDMQLMSLCRHHILANSTFSWWGAWLDSAPEKIVLHPIYHMRDVPTRDFYPHNWIGISGK